MRKDGRLLEWKMLFVKQEENGPKLPFFIQWNETDEERRKDLRNIGTITEHKNKVQQIETVHYAVKNVRETVQKWKEVMELTASSVVKMKNGMRSVKVYRLVTFKYSFVNQLGKG